MKSVSTLFLGFIIFILSGSGIAEHMGDLGAKALLDLEDTSSEFGEEAGPYSVGEEETGEPNLGLPRDSSMDEEPIEQVVDGITHDSGGQESERADHQMPEIKLSEHEWVPTSRKGYGVAVGITLLVGAVFGVINFIRPI